MRKIWKKNEGVNIKVSNGKIFMNIVRIMDRWNGFFNVSDKVITRDNSSGDIQIQICHKMEEEITELIKWLKNGKAPGKDKIMAEMVKI